MTKSTLELRDKINTKTLNLVLLCIATVGIYPLLWLYRNASIIDEVTGTKTVDDIFIIWIAVCAGLGSFFGSFGNETTNAISGILVIATSVLYIVCAFKMKTALLKYANQDCNIDFSMNAIYTVFFTIYYINYCINDIAASGARQSARSKAEA